MTGVSASGSTSGSRSGAYATRLLILLAAVTITLAGMKSISGILGPIFLALVLTITLHPIRTWLEVGGRFPEWAASVIMLVGAYLLLVLLSLALIVSIAQLAALVPQYSAEIKKDLADIGNTLQGLGVKQDQINAVVSAIDPGKLVGAAMSVLSDVLGLASNLLFLILMLLFITFDTNVTRKGLAAIGDRYPGPVQALGSFAHATRSYMGVSAGFGLIVAIIDGAVLYFMGIPGAFIWAVLAFVTNFIPNIGFIIGVIPPALIGLLEGGVGTMVAVIVVYCVINFVIQSVIQPRVVGDAVGLSATLTMLSVVFWTWIIGPLGAILAVPLSLLTRAFLIEANPDNRWALPLIAGKPPRPEVPELPERPGSEPVEAPGAGPG